MYVTPGAEQNAAVARSVATPATLTLRLMSTAPQKVVDVQQEIAETTQRWMDAVTSGEYTWQDPFVRYNPWA